VALPATPLQTGLVARVAWSLDQDRMRVETRGLVDTPAGAWLLANPSLTWAAAPAAVTWAAWNNPGGI